jgi:hypothetical protein
MTGFNQLLTHLFGDYILQSAWMANNKTKRWLPAVVHTGVYIAQFLILFNPSLAATFVMVGTHLAIDRFRLAKYVAFANQYLAPPNEWRPWSECKNTGYHKDTPVWLATWLMIIVDNTMHLVINYWSLTRL